VAIIASTIDVRCPGDLGVRVILMSDLILHESHYRIFRLSVQVTTAKICGLAEGEAENWVNRPQ
jgi:hypothetical protein